MALPKLDADSTLTVTGRFESGAYVDITLDTLKAANAAIAYGEDRRHYAIRGGCGYNMPALCARKETGQTRRSSFAWVR